MKNNKKIITLIICFFTASIPTVHTECMSKDTRTAFALGAVGISIVYVLYKAAIKNKKALTPILSIHKAKIDALNSLLLEHTALIIENECTVKNIHEMKKKEAQQIRQKITKTVADITNFLNQKIHHSDTTISFSSDDQEQLESIMQIFTNLQNNTYSIGPIALEIIAEIDTMLTKMSLFTLSRDELVFLHTLFNRHVKKIVRNECRSLPTSGKEELHVREKITDIINFLDRKIQSQKTDIPFSTSDKKQLKTIVHILTNLERNNYTIGEDSISLRRTIETLMAKPIQPSRLWPSFIAATGLTFLAVSASYLVYSYMQPSYIYVQ